MSILHGFFNEISQQQKNYFFFLLLWAGLLLAGMDGGGLAREGQHLEDVTNLWWNWPLQGWNSTIAFPWFRILGLHFRSKAEDYGLFTDVLKSEFPSDFEMLCLLKNYILKEKQKNSQVSHLFSLWNSTVTLYLLEIWDKVQDNPQRQCPKSGQDYERLLGPKRSC